MKTRSGQVIEVPDGREYVWPPNRLCPRCHNVAWRITVDKDGQVVSHTDQHGQRFVCTAHTNARRCVVCGLVKIMKRASAGWKRDGERWFCGLCKGSIGKNSLLYWHPKLEGISAPQPRTICVEVSRRALLDAFDELSGKPPEFDLDELKSLEPHREALYEAGRNIGYPLFLRTDQTSGKHDWLRTCFVRGSGGLLHHVLAVTEFSECAQMPFGLPLEAMVLREYIAMDSAFFAFNGMPVSRERRYFVSDGRVVCHHPYWPEEAMRFDPVEPKAWREKLAWLNHEPHTEIDQLSAYAIEISEQLPTDAWSVDFCRGADGTWYFIDMALAGNSWHPECPEA